MLVCSNPLIYYTLDIMSSSPHQFHLSTNTISANYPPPILSFFNFSSLFSQNLSVLESHHWRFAISCIKESGMFAHFTADQWQTVHRLLSILIMATDISQQSTYLKKFRETLNTNKNLDMSNAQNRLFVMQIALKCADLCNSCRPWSLSKRWTQQICEEFYRQGDLERKMNIKITPICDRREASMARIQTG